MPVEVISSHLGQTHSGCVLLLHLELLSTESEELNRVFVLVVAQCLQISNMDATNWLEPFMRTVLTSTPNSWSETMLAFFPAAARQFCSPPNLAAFRVALINKVEEEHKRFKGTANEMEQIRLFSETESSALFLCVLWKVLLETGAVSPVCIKIAQRTQPKKIAAQMRRLVDYIIFTLPPLGSSPNQLNSVILRLNELVWKACMVCLMLCVVIFFDDYSNVLITGYSLRSVMGPVGTSREKFAFIVQSMGPTLPSVVPISSWIGVQIGYVQEAFAFKACAEHNATTDPFFMVVKSIPYRFFPLLMLASVVVVCVLGRDFGPMLSAELHSTPPLRLSESDQESEDVELVSPSSKETEGLLTGPLAPKKGVPYRWFNAVVPFLVVIIVTLVGMVLSGRQAILDMPEGNRAPMTVVNIFRYTASVDALIWASALASLIAMVMYFVQCILSLREFMEAWIEGIKDIMEALIILMAWVLGAAVQDILTPNYIAQSLQNRLSAQYLPVIVTLLGFLMAFATGSAFGTMGILFPLVIPTVCQITCNQDTWVQVTAAVLASSIYGNVVSPIADLTVLTAVATKCPMASHLKTTLLYALLVGAISLVFGSLPVGAGWYPWWAAWIIMFVLLVLLFIISASDSSHTSRSLCNRALPCLYTLPSVLWKKTLLFLSHWCRKRRGDQPTEFRPNVNTTDTEILDPENVSLLASKQEGLTHRYYSSTADK